MTEQKGKGLIYAGKKLAELVTTLGSAGLDTLNTNNKSASLLASTVGPNRDNILKRECGISGNPLSLTIIRLLAFSNLKKEGIEFKWYQNPLLGNVR